MGHGVAEAGMAILLTLSWTQMHARVRPSSDLVGGPAQPTHRPVSKGTCVLWSALRFQCCLSMQSCHGDSRLKPPWLYSGLFPTHISNQRPGTRHPDLLRTRNCRENGESRLSQHEAPACSFPRLPAVTPAAVLFTCCLGCCGQSRAIPVLAFPFSNALFSVSCQFLEYRVWLLATSKGD